MYKEHEAFAPPPPDAVLWRYMDFTKFVSLLEKQALFFARADKLKDDPFEGAWPDLSRARIRKFLEEPTGHLVQTLLPFFKELRRFTLINCWHESPHESAAMWKLYSKDDYGIAIKTNFDSFAKSFTSSEEIFIGRINYIDYETADPIGDHWCFHAFLCKRRSFKHESEVRAIVQKLPPGNQIVPPGHQAEGKDGVVDLSQDIFDVGNSYKVDLSFLIQEVIVSPYAPDWLVELVKSVAARYKLKAPVNKSRLADPPTWS